jgi:acetyl-CoA carboxylase alpha subunit
LRPSGLSLVDTAGAYPGIDAEARGQAEAIARSTEACLKLGVPNVAIIIGEGGSGGAIAIATANTSSCWNTRFIGVSRRRVRLHPVA